MLTVAIADSLFKNHGVRFFPPVKKDTRLTGAEVRFEARCQHLPGQIMPLGAYSYTRSYSQNVSEIGRYCSIGANLTVMPTAHPVDWVSSSPVFYKKSRYIAWTKSRPLVPLCEFDEQVVPVTIGHDVWIGDEVTIRGGCHVGNGAITGHSAVVTEDVPPFAVVGGVPARIIRYRFAPDLCARLAAAMWWDYGPEALHQLQVSAPKAFINAFERDAGNFKKRPYVRKTIAEFLSDDGPSSA